MLTTDTVASWPRSCKGNILGVHLPASIYNEIRSFKNKAPGCKTQRHSLSHNCVIKKYNCEVRQHKKWQFENTATELLSAALFQLIYPSFNIHKSRVTILLTLSKQLAPQHEGETKSQKELNMLCDACPWYN